MSSYRFCRERYLTIRAGYLCCLNDPWKDFTTALNHIRNEYSYRRLRLGGGWVNKYTEVLVGHKWKYLEEEDIRFTEMSVHRMRKRKKVRQLSRALYTVCFRYKIHIFKCVPGATGTSVARLENFPVMEITLRSKLHLWQDAEEGM
jgi:hypothetical protein